MKAKGVNNKINFETIRPRGKDRSQYRFDLIILRSNTYIVIPNWFYYIFFFILDLNVLS